jgi:hypothetical protein
MFSFLRAINNFETDRIELRKLINQSAKIALVCLQRRYENDWRAFSYQGLTLQDIAVDAIVPLFVKSNQDEPLPIKKALVKWTEPIETEAAAYFFFSKIIGNRIEQEISRKLKEADPFFGKILRSLNYFIERNGYTKKVYFNTVYIVEKPDSEINQKPPNPDFIDSLPFSVISAARGKLIEGIFDYIKTESGYFPAIPLNSLVRKIKHFYVSSPADAGILYPEELEDRINISEIISFSLSDTFEKLDKLYFRKGRFTKPEVEAFKSVLTEFSDDLQNGGMNRGMYEYLNTYMVDLSKADFYLNYHSALDYLLRLLKKGIAARLEAGA